MTISNPIIEKVIAIYLPNEDMIHVTILWSNKINSIEESYVKIDLEAKKVFNHQHKSSIDYGCTLIEHNNISDTGRKGIKGLDLVYENFMYFKEQKIHGYANEVILRTYNINGLSQELKIPVIIIGSI